MTENKKPVLTPDQHHGLCRRFAKGVASGIPEDPDRLVAMLAECFRAEALPLAEAILEVRDHEAVHALTGMLETHTKHAAGCGCPFACMSATMAHRIEETVRGNETGSARAFLAMAVRSLVEAFVNAIRADDDGTFVRAVSNSFFHKEYAHILAAAAASVKEAVDGSGEERPDDHEVN